MANIKSAIKRIKTSRRDQIKNRKAKKSIKNAIQTAMEAILVKKEEAHELVKKAISIIDKYTGKGIIHRNTAARKKANLTKKLTSIKK